MNSLGSQKSQIRKLSHSVLAVPEVLSKEVPCPSSAVLEVTPQASLLPRGWALNPVLQAGGLQSLPGPIPAILVLSVSGHTLYY